MEVDCKIPVSVVLPDPTNSVEIKDEIEARPIEYCTFYGTDTQQIFDLDVWLDAFVPDVLEGNNGNG